MKKRMMFLLLLLAGWIGIMLFFSSQNGEMTAATSGSLSDFICRIFFGDANEAMAPQIDYFLRKFAHFFLYMIFAILIIQILKCNEQLSFIKISLFSTGIVAAISVLDEFHKIFIQGRHCNFIDICINFFGGLFVVFLYFLWNGYKKLKKQHILIK